MNHTHLMQWWQRDDLHYDTDGLTFARRNVEQLARRLGTPSFIYSVPRVLANLRRIHQALDETRLQNRYQLHYAMKANRFAPLLTALKHSGLCGIDACSPAEVEHAVSCGFEPSDISFTATSLSSQDWAVLQRYKGLSMNCDSLHAIRTWGTLCPGGDIGIRINPAVGISRGGNDKLQYAGAVTTKFGIYREQFQEALALAKQYDLKVSKIHFHTGCGYLNPQLPLWEEVLTQCLWFVDQATDVRIVNIGGGLGVPHTADDEALTLPLWANILDKHFGSRDIVLEVEPGDYLVKDCGLLLLSKTFCEVKKDTLFVGTDAGFNIAPEPAYYDLPFQVVPLHYQSGQALKDCQVVGHINEALDVWDHNAALPDPEKIEFLAVINAGAYSSSMASNHCMRGQFKEFIIL